MGSGLGARLELGALQDGFARTMRWPHPLSHRLALKTILEPPRKKVIVSPTPHSAREKILRAFEKARNKGVDPHVTPVCVDIGASRRFEQFQVGMSPCLTHSRGQVGGFYISTHNRKCTVDEMFRLQGINPQNIPWQDLGIARSTIGGAIGNAMSVNVLERLLPRVAYAAGLLHSLPLDKWEDPQYNPFSV